MKLSSLRGTRPAGVSSTCRATSFVLLNLLYHCRNGYAISFEKIVALFFEGCYNGDMDTESEFITPSDVAKLKGCNKATVYRAIAAGRLPHVAMLGHVGIRRSDAEGWTPEKRGGSRGGGRPKKVS